MWIPKLLKIIQLLNRLCKKKIALFPIVVQEHCVGKFSEIGFLCQIKFVISTGTDLKLKQIDACLLSNRRLLSSIIPTKMLCTFMLLCLSSVKVLRIFLVSLSWFLLLNYSKLQTPIEQICTVVHSNIL